VSFLEDLPRGWVTVEMPGAAEPLAATYVAYRGPRLPESPHGADVAWLGAAPVRTGSSMAAPASWAVRDVSLENTVALMGGMERLPHDLRVFLAGGLRSRLRSATDCYFDLGDHTVEIDGGRLLHLVSDSQWVFHWLLYVGDAGESAVLGTPYPAGFTVGAEELASWEQTTWEYTVVADSFSEFVWRWWMDNEIFFTAVVDEAPLTDTQLRYVDGLGSAQPL
jgi:hypothetical protein